MTIEQLVENRRNVLAEVVRYTNQAGVSPLDRHPAMMAAIWTTNLFLAELLLTQAEQLQEWRDFHAAMLNLFLPPSEPLNEGVN
jgi:hypothetical protein